MTIEERLYQLLSPATIAQLFPVTAPDQTATPYTVYRLMDEEPYETQSHALESSLRTWHIQFSSYSENYGTSRSESQKIINLLCNFRDAGIRAVFLKPGRRTTWEDDTKFHHSMIELRITEALG